VKKKDTAHLARFPLLWANVFIGFVISVETTHSTSLSYLQQNQKMEKINTRLSLLIIVPIFAEKCLPPIIIIIIIIIRDLGWDCMDWIDLAEDRVQWGLLRTR
jgi:hypothetical protein